MIRNLLINTKNTHWAEEVKSTLEKNIKIKVFIATNRNQVVELLSHTKFQGILFEDTCQLKDINYLLRYLSTRDTKFQRQIFFTFLDFDLYGGLEIPDELDALIQAISLPQTAKILCSLLENKLIPLESGIARGDNGVQLDKEFTIILLKAAMNVMGQMIPDCGLTPGEIFTLGAKDDLNIVIRGKIIIKSAFFTGSFFICFPKETYLLAYEKLTGIKVTEIDHDNEDFAGSLANMIYGQAKKYLNEEGVTLEMAIPTVDTAKQLFSKDKVFVIPFDSRIGKLYIKIAQNLL